MEGNVSRKDELIREAAAEIDRINKVLGRVEYRGWYVPFGVDYALAAVKRLLAEAAKEGNN